MPLANIALYCSKAERRVPGWWGGVVVQTDFHVKPTTKLLWVAFGLGCCCLAWLWGYDNLSLGKCCASDSVSAFRNVLLFFLKPVCTKRVVQFDPVRWNDGISL